MDLEENTRLDYVRKLAFEVRGKLVDLMGAHEELLGSVFFTNATQGLTVGWRVFKKPL